MVAERRIHDIFPLLNMWTDDDLRVLGDLGYEGEQATIIVAFKKPKNRARVLSTACSPDNSPVHDLPFLGSPD